MKIAHVVTLFSPEHGGPTQEISAHAIAQAQLGNDVVVYCIGGYAGTSPPVRLGGDVRQVIGNVTQPEILGFSAELVRAIERDPAPDVYHIHGVWHLTQAYTASRARRTHTPYLYHLMGGYNAYEIERKWLRKRISRLLYQDRVLRAADCIHVNSPSEATFLREMGYRNPICVVPVGVDTETPSRRHRIDAPRLRGMVGSGRVLLYLARLHPTKGVELLLDTWAVLARSFPDWTLLVAGAGDAKYTSALRNRVADLKLDAQTAFAGFVTNDERQWCYQNTDLYVLPSFNENFGNTVPEALSFGVPVVTTTQTPWSVLETEQCGWISPPTVEDLADRLSVAMSMTADERRAYGARGAALVERRFSTRSVIRDLQSVYEWLCGAPRPPCVSVYAR